MMLISSRKVWTQDPKRYSNMHLERHVCKSTAAPYMCSQADQFLIALT